MEVQILIAFGDEKWTETVSWTLTRFQGKLPDMTIKRAIRRGDLKALAKGIRDHPDRIRRPISWGRFRRNKSPPIHYVCDMVFAGHIDEQRSVEVVDALLSVGADPNAVHPETHDSLLITAASLGAEGVAIRLLGAGAKPNSRGLFGATALHWAAMMGLDRLATTLIASGAELNAKDQKYEATPVGWALHGWKQRSGLKEQTQARVVVHLVGSGADVTESYFEELSPVGDDEMIRALRGEGEP